MATTRPEHWIAPEAADTLCGLFAARVARSPDALAYRFYSPRRHAWVELTWAQAADRVAAWRAVLDAAGIGRGDRVAIMLRNSPEWLCVDQAVMSLGAITVGLFCNDTPASNAHLIADSGARLLVAVKARWAERILAADDCPDLERALIFSGEPPENTRIASADAALAVHRDAAPPDRAEAGALASLIYTSGSAGRARGAMLTHANLLSNAHATADALPAIDDEHALSYVPLPHSYERVVNAYRAMIVGAVITFCRHPRFLGLTLARAPITTLVGVPRIYERFYVELNRWIARQPRFMQRLVRLTIATGQSVFERQQGRSRRRARHLLWPLLRYFVARPCLRRFGGQMEVAISGAAALPYPVACTLVGLGLPVLQGYGLTEAGPVVSVNRIDDNQLDSVGRVLDGIETKIGPDNELLVRGPGVMRGYWNRPAVSDTSLAAGGWLHTGDKVSRLDKQRLYLTGRMKEIVVMTTGEKASPEPIEETLQLDELVERAVVVGEARPVLAAVVSCSAETLTPVMQRLSLDPAAPASLISARLENFFIERFAVLLAGYPTHAQIRRVAITTDRWSEHNGLVTATGKIRRRRVARCYAREITRLYGRRTPGEKMDVSQNTNLG
ncbi:AMP-dependent synthetase/ligase [Salinisphaera orenii]|uniref:AMP-dependent synthetase n=1 Tax=Salinisphaera orenii YIM 95161 TaxID=1051139 RepID=A0A423PKE2_9GAMM|nr:AMP-binding protein [Salinisphaera halophila]ROO26043.1 AMP-dependent synthetase [Salinisphaera halophila YIM 95161]